MFHDQFAFRRRLYHGRPKLCITLLYTYLKTHRSVHLIALDFSKAFDTVKHHPLASFARKIANFPISDNVYNWVINFLSSRQHKTKANGCISTCQHIDASIVHGSGMGPVAYLLNASDLQPIDQDNMIFKYADDTYLIVPGSNIQTIPMELQHISKWTMCHKLELNETKSKEIIISLLKTHIPAATHLTRVESLKVLGVTFNTKLSFKPHISYIIQSAARSFYGFKTLRAHGLTGKSLRDVTRATLIARIIYAAPAWCMGILTCCGEGPHRVGYQ